MCQIFTISMAPLSRSATLNMRRWSTTERSSSTREWTRSNSGEKCSACSLRQAIPGSPSKIHRISARPKITSGSSTPRISAPRSFSTHLKRRQPSAISARSTFPNLSPTGEAKNSTLRHRPIGLGIMGFQDALYVQNISYASHKAVEFADKSMEMISYYAILASTELAHEKGTYPTYKGSKWDRGFIPLDTIDLLDQERGIKVDLDRTASMDWTPVRQAIKKHGMRNSNTMAIAPTATIGNITGAIPSNEPIYKHLFVKSNLSGEFTIVNPYLVEKLKQLD